MDLDEHLLGCVSLRQCPSPTAHRRLAEAHLFWHRCLDGYQEPDAFTADLNACIQALRNVTFTLQKEMSHREGFPEWYGLWRGAMGRSAFMKWAIRARNIVVKQGDFTTESTVIAKLIIDYQDIAASVHRDLTDPSLAITDLQPPVFASLDEIKHSALSRGVPAQDLANAVVLVERRWVDTELPGAEILNALAYVFSFLSTVVADADIQFSVALARADLDPATVGSPGATYPNSLRPSCMVTTREARSMRFRLKDGDSDISGKSWPATFDPKIAKKAAERYGVQWASIMPSRGARTALDLIPAWTKSAVAILRSGEGHGWFMYFFSGPRIVHTEILMARDKADKYALAQSMAEIAARNNADGVIEIGELWQYKALYDPKGNMVDVDKNAKRTEALGISGELATGERLYITIPFQRTFYGAVTVGDPVETTGEDNFLAPTRASGPRQSQVMPRISNDLDGSRAVQRMPAAMLV
jgi:hypothetical protein